MAWHIGNPKIQILKKGIDIIAPDTQIVIVSYSLMNKHKRQLAKFNSYGLFMDESHYLKNEKTVRTKAAIGSDGFYKNSNQIICLSGTPLANRPIELWTILNALTPQTINYMNKFQYGMKYCAGYKSPFGWDFTGASNMNELGQRLRSDLMVRRSKESVLKDLPEKMLNIVYLEQNREVGKLIAKMKNFDLDKVIRQSGVSVDFSEISKLRRELGISKVDQAAKYILEQLTSGHRKIVVFAHHQEVVQELEIALKECNPVTFTGTTSEDAKNKAIYKFQNDPSCRVFIGSSAAYVGITLTAASYVVFVEFSFVPGDNEQAIDRCHRIGQKNSVLAEFLVYENSLDENIIKAHMQKDRIIKKIMED